MFGDDKHNSTRVSSYTEKDPREISKSLNLGIRENKTKQKILTQKITLQKYPKIS